MADKPNPNPVPSTPAPPADLGHQETRDGGLLGFLSK
jgi:hypothetical protein